MDNIPHPIIDAHCDALLAVVGKSQIHGDLGRRNFLIRNEKSHIDLPKLLEGGVICQFMALFTGNDDLPEAYAYTSNMIDELDAIVDASGGAFFPILKGSDLDKAIPGQKVGALLSIEGAEALEGRLDALDEFYERGVRALGVSWSRRNPFARGVSVEGTDGLTDLGVELVAKMEAKPMIVDVSHLSDQAFDDLALVSKRPFIASHSNSRALNNHPRNLTDAQIRRIADSGGAIGVVFVPNFVALPPTKPYLDHLLDHIDAIVKAGGIDSVAIGSDFDGYRGVEGHVIADTSEFHFVVEALQRQGYDSTSVDKILWKNWDRVIREIKG